jgi:hypothetical protein
VFIPEITGLQIYLPDPTVSTNASLMLYLPYLYATKLQQDTLDVLPLSSLATFGGF